MRIIFAGTPEFAVPCLKALTDANENIVGVFTQPERPLGRGQKIQWSPVKQLAIEHKIPVFQPATLKSKEAIQQVTQLNADIMFVVAYGLLLPPAILSAPKYGCINVHASILPRCRGAAPIQYAILSGDQETGVTTFQMDAGMDTGPMLIKKFCPIESTDTTGILSERLSHVGAQALMETLQLLKNKNLRPISQDNQFATYAPKITKSQAQIKWNQPAVEIDRTVRAFNPWPIAYTQLDGQVIRVWQSQVVDTELTERAPGTIIQVNPEGLDVATAKGILRLTILQLPGGRALGFKEIFQGHRDLFASDNIFH